MHVPRIQDSVHGLMELPGASGQLLALLSSGELQRLRRVRQLGLAHLVFPGAEHSRFAHSLGAAYLATCFGAKVQSSARYYLSDVLVPTDSDIRDLAVAALCHDLGHGPLSHAWEREIVGDLGPSQRKAWAASLGLENEDSAPEKWHELVGQALILSEESELHAELERIEDGFAVRVADLLRGVSHLPYLPRLLSGDIDVDRGDFILRDSSQCGVTYGRYDLNWLLASCTVGQTEADDYVVGFDGGKAVRAVEEFVLARRSLYETVYHHKTVRCAEGMFAAFLRRLKHLASEGKTIPAFKFVEPLVKMIRGETIGPRELIRLDDFTIWVLLEEATNQIDDPVVNRLGAALLKRQLFKLVRCSSDAIQSCFMSEHGREAIAAALRSEGLAEGPEYFMILDKVKFSLLSASAGEVGFFVGKDRRATRMRDHEVFRQHRISADVRHRLFVPREAREAVEKAISKKAWS